MNPTSYPRPKCLAARFLARLIQGETLKHRQADDATGSYRLAAFIHYLQASHGWHIERREVTEDTKDPTGRSAKYMEYWLPSWVITHAGARGQEFVEKVFELETKRIAERLAATSPTADDNPSGTDKAKTSRNPDTSGRPNNGSQ